LGSFLVWRSNYRKEELPPSKLNTMESKIESLKILRRDLANKLKGKSKLKLIITMILSVSMFG